MRILVVEDDPVLSDLLHEYLMLMAHERVQVCLTGREAYTSVRRELYDCAFIDLQLPDMDGIRLLQLIKNRDPGLPVVMMSGYPTMKDTIEAMRKGASDFLMKPFTFQDLALAVERVSRERALLLENLRLKLECQSRKELEELNHELQEVILEQQRLFELSAEMDAVCSSEDLYPRFVQLAVGAAEARCGAFFLYLRDHDNLLLLSGHGMDPAHPLLSLRQFPHDCLKATLRAETPYVLIGSEELLGRTSSLDRFRKEAVFACWPLRIREQPFGLVVTWGHENPVFSPARIRLMGLLLQKASLIIENVALHESLPVSFYGIFKSLVHLFEARDVYAGNHSERVTGYAVDIARQMGCSSPHIKVLQTAGTLHDLGKVVVADSILNKPGALSEEEYQIVKEHPVIGESILGELGMNAEERAVIRHHHGRWDGCGYPDGLSQEVIPPLARVLSVADAFDAMTSRRAYRGAMSVPDALQELRRERGKRFDPAVVDTFAEALGGAANPEEKQQAV